MNRVVTIDTNFRIAVEAKREGAKALMWGFRELSLDKYRPGRRRVHILVVTLPCPMTFFTFQ